MGKRSTGRRLAMQVLYQADITGESIDEALKKALRSDEEKYLDETKDFAVSLATGAFLKREDLDREITKLSIDWPLDRIGIVDKSILRLAIYELKKGETPSSVVINEAVELAKKYSSGEAAKFINGILGSFIRSSGKSA